MPGNGSAQGNGQLPGMPGDSTGQGGSGLGGAGQGDGSTQGGGGSNNSLVPNGQSGTGTVPGRGGMTGGGGGLLNATTPNEELVAVLTADAERFTWVAATVGSQSAAGYQLATEQPVMPIGGFNGSDPSPTLEQFQQLVAEGQIHYFIPSGRGGSFGNQNGGSDAAQQITAWVESTFTATTIGGTTVYDLTTSTASAAGTPAQSI